VGNRWGPDGPPPEAYSRVTDAERFRPLVAAADDLVARLSADYDVAVTTVDEPYTLRAVRLVPGSGAPLVVGVTDFPGVRLRLGHWTTRVLPDCGCDACDESAADAIAGLVEIVDDVVGGAFTEQLRRWRPGLTVELGRTSSWSMLGRVELRELVRIARPRRHSWPAWPLRGPRLNA
jgi:Family of unknown function (DUF6226)